MKTLPCPVKGRKSLPDTIKVHNGFHDYLFEKTRRGAKGSNGEPLSEYEEILQEHVLPVIKKYPTYKVRITTSIILGFYFMSEHVLIESYLFLYWLCSST